MKYCIMVWDSLQSKNESEENQMQELKDLQVVEVKGIRTLTSKQIAECYETTTDTIKKNFSRNRERFTEGKHYICFSGDELKEFKNEVTKVHPVNKQVTISALVGNRASHLYLWTEKGALLHAKSLNTDKAWEVYDYLVDFYFRAQKEIKVDERTTGLVTTAKSQTLQVVNIMDNEDAQKLIANLKKGMATLEVLVDGCNKRIERGKYESLKSAITEVTMTVANNASKLALLEPGPMEQWY